jgi:hypothetical protein
MKQQEQVARAAAAIVRAIRRKDEQGRPVYGEAEIQHAIPWIAFSMGADVHALHPRMQATIARFILSLKLPEGASPDAVRAAVNRFYELHPIAPGLVADVRIAFRSAVAELSSSNSGEGAHGRVLAGRSRTQALRSALRTAVDEST